MRRILLVLLPLALAPLVGCGGGGTTGGDEEPGEIETTPMVFGDGEEVLLRIQTGGGFVPVIFAQREVPDVLLFDDGRLVRHRGDGSEVVPEFEEVQLDEAETAELLASAAAVVGGPDVGNPAVTDLPTMTIDLADDGGTRTLAIYAPGFEDGLSQEQRAARAAADQLVEDLDRAGGTDAGQFVPDEWLALTMFSGIEPGGIAPWPLEPERMASDDTPDVCTRLTRDELLELAAALEDGTEEGMVASANGSAELALRPVLTGDESCNLGEHDQFVER